VIGSFALTAAALVAFAGNSLLCRMALGQGAIDAASFSTIRLIAGACSLAAITAAQGSRVHATPGAWTSAAALFLYAIPFSFAYVWLPTGTGALILFGAVQVTMMLGALAGGERPRGRQWIGLVLAVAGLVYLVLPGLAAPPPAGAALMAVAGVAWGIYSLRGRGAVNPLGQNAGSFARSIPLALAVSVLAFRQFHLEARGVMLAIASGALASALGYVAWYSALRHLSATRASLVQLLVPVLAAAGGIVFLGEPLSLRLVLSAAIVLGGIAMALLARGETTHAR
jgi:drug/metabolite transporter (DMT)-like permease